MTSSSTNIGTSHPARLLALTSLGLLLLGIGPQQAQGHVMMAASPFNGLGRGDRALGRFTRMVDELVNEQNLLPPTVLPIWRKVMQHQTTDMNQQGPAPGSIAAFRADAIETQNTYIISADLPGVKRENIKIAFLQDGVLSITAERQSLYEVAPKVSEDGGAVDAGKGQQPPDWTNQQQQVDVSKEAAEAFPKFLMREVMYGKTTRSFKLPPDADTDSTTAGFENGVLVVTMKKRQAPKEKLVQIK